MATTDTANQLAVGANLIRSEPLDSHTIGSAPQYDGTIPGQPADAEVVHEQDVGLEQESFEQAQSRMVGSEAKHSENVVQEIVKSESLDSYQVVSEADQLVGEELDHHLEDLDISYTQTSDADIRNLEAMISEHVNSEAADHKGEFMTTGSMVTSCLEHDDSQPVDAELAYTHHSGSQLVHVQQPGSDIVYSQPLSSELLVGSELVMPVNMNHSGMEPVSSPFASLELASSDPINPETHRRRKKKSIVWEHFTIEPVADGSRRAFCNVCRRSFSYSTGVKVSGTSHLKRHIAKGTCAVMLEHEKNQLSPYMPKIEDTKTGAGTDPPPKKRSRSSSSPFNIFDLAKCRIEIARMVVMHEYPLNIVEHPGFLAFVQTLQPRFFKINSDIVRNECVGTYLREKQYLQKLINGLSGRICLILDVWNSRQSMSYIFLTGQFIDNDWKVHRCLLNVMLEPFLESDNALGRAVATCLPHWGLDNKLFTITVDQPLSDTGRENMAALLSVKNHRILNGQLLVVNCLAHTLTSMALEVLAAGEHVVKKVRESVKYVKASYSNEEKFLELKQQLQVPSEKTLALDNLTRWDTTYHMLLGASDLKEMFSCFDASDPDYKGTPTLHEWKQVESICVVLKLLHETADLLSGKTSPPPTIFFHEVWNIQLELTRTAASNDPFASNLGKQLQEKFKKYWEDTCLVLAVAVAMDPRFKMKLVNFSFTKIFGEQAPGYITAVEEGIREMFHKYQTLTLPLTPAYLEGSNGMHVVEEQQVGGDSQISNRLADFDTYMMDTASHQSKSELDEYLEESLLPRVQEFDVLAWWKLNRIKYPTLSMMARDILTIPLSTVNPDSVFDTVRKEMDPYRSSLRPEILEALFCAKDWLQQEPSSESLD
ncbi:Zinc finger BED domain-containing protein [Drosera capensis]